MNFTIDKNEIINFNSNKYFLRIRSGNENNPVVLFLHGGCGSPDRAQVMKYQSPLAEKFTLVAFDQRGSGYAYDGKEAKSLDLTKEIYVEDVHNVVDYLKQRFNKDKIIIVGHSFGSVLGVWFHNNILKMFWHMSVLVNASIMSKMKNCLMHGLWQRQKELTIKKR